VLGGALLATLALSFAGLVALRYLGPQFGYRSTAMVLGLLIGAATFVLGLLMVRLLLRPITTLSDQAMTLQADPNHALPLLPHYGTRELRHLGQSIHQMAAALQNREASIRAFTDHVTHELKTPVTSIRAAAELLADTATGPDARLIQQIMAATTQMQTQLDALRRVTAAREPGHHGECRVSALLPALRAEFPGLDLKLTGQDAALPLAASGMFMVLGHLLQNAAQHGARAVVLHSAAGELTVTDDGAGISPGNQPHVFEPFFTTTRDQGGTGMGLTIIANLLQAHSARILLMPSPQGACFTLKYGDQA